MREHPAHYAVRYDGTLRVVMWMDAFLSVAVVLIGVIVSPLVAVVDVPRSMTFTLGMATIVSAVLLAAFGAITGVLLMMRMRSGEYFLPEHLRLPLPPAMRPEFDVTRGGSARR
jgi:hypothetical protein